MHHATVFFECEGGFEMNVASPFPVEDKGYVVWCKKKLAGGEVDCTVNLETCYSHG